MRGRIMRESCLLVVRLLAQLQRSSIIAVTLVAIAVYICLVVQKISKKYENVTDLLLCLYLHHITVFMITLVAVDMCLPYWTENQQNLWSLPHLFHILISIILYFLQLLLLQWLCGRLIRHKINKSLKIYRIIS